MNTQKKDNQSLKDRIRVRGLPAWLAVGRTLNRGADIVVFSMKLIFAIGAISLLQKIGFFHWIFGNLTVIILIVIIGCFFFVMGKLKNFFNPPPPPPPPEIKRKQRNAGPFGDAGWAHFGEIHNHGLFPSNMPDRSAVYLQRFIDVYGDLAPPDLVEAPEFVLTNWPLTYRRENSLLTIAPAGSGKNAAAIMPSLMLCDDSAFVLDLKGENWWVTRHVRVNRMGHRIVTLNPFNIWGEELGYDPARPITHCFNPLESLDPDAPNFVTAIDGLADALIVQHVGSDGGHFDGRARDLVACVMAFVCSDAVERKAGNNNLVRVREILAQDKAVFCAWAEGAAESPIPRVRNVAASFINVLSKETDGVLSTVNRQTGWLDNPQVQHFVRRSDINFADLKQQPVTVYVMIAPELIKTYRPLVRLIVQSFFSAMKAKIATAGDRQVLAVLDEVNQLGRMEAIEQAPSIMRGYGVRVWNIFQDCNQMKQTYGDAWQTFEANADIVQIFTPNDLFTAEHFSKRIGNTTIAVESVSNSVSSSHNVDASLKHSGGSTSSTSGRSYAQQGRSFLLPDELMGLNKDLAIVFFRGMKYPILTSRLAYFQDIEILHQWDMPYFPLPHKDGHNYPGLPHDLIAHERNRAEEWRKAWALGHTQGQYWNGEPIP